MLKRDNWITLYNICHGNDGETSSYNRTTMYVHLEEFEGVLEKGKAERSSDTFLFFVPHVVERETGKTYIEPEAYLALADKSKYFTFRKGDIVLIGKVDEDIVSEREFTMSHPEHVRVRGCHHNNFGSLAMRHWEVSCD